jgi:hypothetical protein
MKNRLHLDSNPSFRRADWLPENSGWPELDALHEQHVRLLAQVAQTSTAAANVHRRHEAEDEHRKNALTAAYRDGTEVAKLPQPTPPEQRQAELAAATEQGEAAIDALEEFIGQALTTLAAHRDEWFDQLDERVAAGEQKRQEARRLVAEADAAAGELHRMGHWLDRQTGGTLGPIPYSELVPRPADRLPTLADDGAPGIELVGPAPDDELEAIA